MKNHHPLKIGNHLLIYILSELMFISPLEYTFVKCNKPSKMKTIELKTANWEKLSHQLGSDFAQRSAKTDEKGTFVTENYEQLKANRFFSAMVPKELGGGGVSHSQMCQMISIIAQYCGSTALAFSMHQHLLAVAVWKYKHKGQSEALLRKVAQQQLVLISTGAKDWLESNGSMKKVDGGYLYSSKKRFASQSVIGDLAVTSGVFLNSEGHEEILHFPVPMKTEGVSVLNDWDVLGMRATGSHTIQFENVFVPDSAISLRRPRGEFHMVWNVVLTIALPLIMSAYIGISLRAKELALSTVIKKRDQQKQIPFLIGKLHNNLLSALTQWKAMHKLCNNLEFQPNESITTDVLSFKTNVAEACLETLNQALDIVGGQSYYRKNELERLFRDIQASRFHPLPKWNQYQFTGERILANFKTPVHN